MFEQLVNLPPKFLERLHLIVPASQQEAALRSICTMRPSTFRVNTLKTTAIKVQQELAAQGILTEQLSWNPNAFILKNVPQKTLTSTEMYKNGEIYVQNFSSMIPPLVLRPQPGEKILDMAAAPGSKTTQMAALMENTGEIIANDTDRIRLDKLEANLKLQGVSNTTITKIPGQLLGKRYPHYFDKVLVDAPCSGEGRFNCSNPKTYTHWTPSLVERMALRQKELLKSAVKATKPGGIVVYSTCTLAPEENEGVIDWLVKTEKKHVTLESVYIPALTFNQPLAVWKKKLFQPLVKQTVRIFPTELMEGFFVAKIKVKTQ